MWRALAIAVDNGSSLLRQRARGSGSRAKRKKRVKMQHKSGCKTPEVTL
jgi:hypothetical protein